MSKNKELRVIDKPIYRYWQAIYLSFYSPSLYRDVSKRWKGVGAFYILLVIAIGCVPLSIRVIHYMTDYIDQELLAPIKLIPPLYIQGGEVSLDKPMPYFVKNKSGNVVAIVDTTGKITEITSQYPHLVLLITKNKLYFREPPPPPLFKTTPVSSAEKKIKVQKISEGDTEVFDAKQWIENSGVLNIRLLVQVMVYPVMLVLFYSIYLVLLLTLPLLGQILAQVFFSFKLKYIEACRVFAVAATPQMLLFFILMTFDIAFPGLGFVYLALLAGYFYYALACIKFERHKMVRS
ncbi:DUF1189 family protein [Legionella impletisoli]|uniref:DUF1189 domain-containing protein n=1 Tax=Legionella impletisoli TaxID=343510 RepID=A0A917JNW8_9GAMM|nr:DUF1189 family protein [Legionella impletisoli]GGI75645.1 hypothetical protein GCM10007966_00540 [Legionella impletisoli]